MSLAIALLLVVPRRLRPAAAVVGLAFVLGMSYSLITVGSHFPSDVLGAYFFAAGASLCLLAGSAIHEARDRATAMRETSPDTGQETLTIAIASVAGGGAIVLGAALLAGPFRIMEFAEANTRASLVAGSLALAATAVIAGTAITVARET